MTKVRKTYSLDDKIVQRLEEAAEAAGLNVSAYLTVLINNALPSQLSATDPQPVASEQ